MTDSLTAHPADVTRRRRWIALVFISIAQLMVIFDASIMNIALPQAQLDLAFSDADRQWVITAYSLAFGALLLLGGRLSDQWGRRRSFAIGLVGFSAASVLGGFAANIEMLVAARVLQGMFAALLAPAAMSLLSVTFPAGRERATAFGVFSTVAGAGGAIGLLLGGVLTEFASWRWTLLVNIIFGAVAVLGALAYIRDPGAEHQRERLDVLGTVLASVGLAALVLGLNQAATEGWGATTTITSFVTSVVLLAVFVAVENRVPAPLLPMRVILDWNRGGADLSVSLAMAGNFTQFLFLTYYMQSILGFSPLLTGVAFLPLVACLIFGSTQLGTRLIGRLPVRWLMGGGYLVGAVGMFWLTRLTVENAYWQVVFPASVIMGLGLGTAFMCSMILATSAVEPQDTGVASAMVNTSQQIGGAVGTALMSAIAAGATAAWLAINQTATSAAAEQAAVHGYVIAFWWAAGALLLAAATSFALVRSTRPSDAATDGSSTDSAASLVHN
ncbi:MFS transporter [Pseudarthrobacter sp. R1]|uniref:MFS transporter n=1 Tax=Pseudarthrobacter sp. R1 TaxID=2944934 RepID=UPI00210AF28B|nr:MFS transporter [Pseudarthrobacter sp. R1]MCQ6269332.1 MFS transporter [Pseudarthrobacter sp. R1]